MRVTDCFACGRYVALDTAVSFQMRRSIVCCDPCGEALRAEHEANREARDRELSALADEFFDELGLEMEQ